MRAFLFLFFFLVSSLEASLPPDSKEGAFSWLSEKHRSWLQEQDGLPERPDEEKVSRIFKKTKRLSKHIYKPATEALRPENKNKNVFLSILPYEETRTLRGLPGFYINANDITTPQQAYIATQCPTSSDVDDFWRTVLLTETPTVVALLMPQDNNGKHAAYWIPDFLPRTVDGWSVSLAEEACVLEQSKASPDQRIVLRTFLAVGQEEKREIFHLHYENWPDFGAPDPGLFSSFLSLADGLHPQKARPLLVHCAAGVGRTGVFIAAHSLRKELFAGEGPINIPKRVLELRLQRPKMVSSTRQFLAVYLALCSVSAGQR